VIARRISVIDFFSGCGGTSLGLEQAGMRIAGGVDNDPDSAEAFQNNFPGSRFLETDIRALPSEALTPLLPRGPLLFAGCAPCQPFSNQNKTRSVADPRRGLLNEFTRMVVAHRPEYVVVENVPGMQRVGRDGPLAGFGSDLERAGYSCRTSILRALDYGVPQERRRLVVVGSLCGPARLPLATHGTGAHPVATVRQTIGDLPPLDDGGVDPLDPDHAAMALSPLNRARIRATPEGGDRRDWPAELRLACHKTYTGHSDVYGRMGWDRPASGLTTRCVSYSNGRFGHPEQHRAITVREAACLQTFPTTFQFTGTLTSRARQVGNAVPPLMAQRIGEALVEASSARMQDST